MIQFDLYEYDDEMKCVEDMKEMIKKWKNSENSSSFPNKYVYLFFFKNKVN